MSDLEAVSRLMAALRLISAAEKRHGQAIAERIGLSASDFEALNFIVGSASATAGAIGGKLGLTSGAVTGVIDRLAKQGLVERVDDPRDRRKVIVQHVAAKIAPVAEMYAPIEQALADLVATHSHRQLVTIAQFLEQAAQRVLACARELDSERA